MSFIDWLHGNGGISGNFDYKLIHVLSVVIIFILTIFLCYFGASKRFSAKSKKVVLYSIAIFQLSFEILWRVVFLAINHTSVAHLWPFYACNLNGILVPLAVLIKNQNMKKLFYVFAFLGGVITFAMPQGIFSNSVLTFPILKSILQHTSLIFIPALEYASGSFRPKIKDFGYIVLGLIIHVANSYGMSTLLGLPGDYLYMQGDLPFVIPHIPQFITMAVTALLVLSLLSLALDPNAFKKMLSRKKDEDNKKLTA